MTWSRSHAQPFADELLWSSTLLNDSQSVAVGDIDADGDLDIVFGNGFGASGGGQRNTVYLNENGMFSTTPSWFSGESNMTMAVALGDIDGDGDLDLVCGNYDQPNAIYLNDGARLATTPAWRTDNSERTEALILGDVDDDGDLDLVFGNSNDGKDEIYRNDDGVFATTPWWSSGVQTGTFGVSLADIDDDGDLDLLCASGQLQSYRNDSGTFLVQPTIISSVGTAIDVQVVDADGDGDSDLVTAGQRDRLFINGISGFVEVWAGGQHSLTVAVGDLDGDRDPDFVSGQLSAIHVYDNDGSGFSISPIWERFDVSLRLQQIALGDFDADGDLDLVSARLGRSNTIHENVSSMLLAATPAWQSSLANATEALAWTDVNGDGHPDLLCGNGSFSSPAANTIYLGHGDGLEDTPSWQSSTIRWTPSLDVGDINHDGLPDVVFGNSGGVEIHMNVDGALEPTPSWTSTTLGVVYVALADFDADGDLDLFQNSTADADSDAIYLNEEGVIQASPAWTGKLTMASNGIDVGDVDGDDLPDVIVARSERTNQLFRNVGGGFDSMPIWKSELVSQTFAMALGDMNGDGRLDVVCANANDENNTMYLNRGATLDSIPAWSSSGSSNSTSTTVGDVNGDGYLDVLFGNAIRPSTLHLNRDGVLDVDTSWGPDRASSVRALALHDVDGDGDLDLAMGEALLGSRRNTLYLGLRNPPFKGDPLAPTYHFPSTDPFLRNARAEQIDATTYRLEFDAVDIESDPLWLFVDYRYEGDPAAYPAAGRVGPFQSSRAGVRGSIDWDFSLIPFDSRNIVLRLRVIAMPTGVSRMRVASSYLLAIGPVTPLRPVMVASTDSLHFAPMSVGDTLGMSIEVANPGTAPLNIHDIRVPPQFRITPQVPLSIAPGESAELQVILEPTVMAPAENVIELLGNDPFSPIETIAVKSDIRLLSVRTRLLTPEVSAGEKLTFLVSPDPIVRLDGGELRYFAIGEPANVASVPLVPSGDDFVAEIPGEQFTELGVHYYVEMWNLPVIARDPPGAPIDSVYEVIPPAPALLTTTPRSFVDDVFFEGRDIRIEVVLPAGAIFRLGTLHYRPGGETRYSSVNIENASPFPLANIPASDVGSRGLEYWAEVETATSTLTDPAVDPAIFPLSIPTTITNLREPTSHAGEQYRLLSIPLAMQGLSALESLSDELGGVNNTRWRLYAHDALQAHYTEFTDSTTFAFEQGHAYWLITRDGHQIGSGPDLGTTAPTDRRFPILLHPGYNLIANPFHFSVAWGACTVDGVPTAQADTVVQPPIAYTAGTGYVFDRQTLGAFEGYWVENISTGPLTLSVPPVEALPLPAIVNEGALVAWQIEVGVLAGKTRGSTASAAVHREASNARDRFDRSLPPLKPGRDLAVYFHPGHAIDRRGTFDRRTPSWGHTWLFDVASTYADANERMTLRFDGSEDVPHDALIIMVDRELDRIIDVREQNNYSVFGVQSPVLDESQARFALLIGNDSFVGQEVARLADTPEVFALAQNYPNPFRPSTVIRYAVAQHSWVSLRVYDIGGALVHVLEEGHRAPGRYEARWRGRNARGENAPPGVYFYRLKTSGGFVSQRKMVLLQ